MTNANFDGIARSYALLEKITFGNALARCRFRFLDWMQDARRALAIGDGDGRFIAALLATNPEVEIDSIDTSAEMLRLQSLRSGQISRLTLFQEDARLLVLPRDDYDLIVTHFFLDCLSQSEVDSLASRIAAHMRPGARWVLSDFAVPDRGASRIFGSSLVRALYFGFRILTGLRIVRLPDHAAAFTAAGLRCIKSDTAFGGLLLSEQWQRQ
jgi:SAM-dependent methyltransferase